MGTTVIDSSDTPMTVEEIVALQREVREVAAEGSAVILTHNSQRPEVQDVADFRRRFAGAVARGGGQRGRGDRVLRRAFHGRDGVDPQPGQDRVAARSGGWLLAGDTITAAELRSWKARHPGARSW
jgi:quinolinate synthase